MLSDENNIPLLEYCKLDRAARLLGCEINDILHWAEIGAIQLCIYLRGFFYLSSKKATLFNLSRLKNGLAKKGIGLWGGRRLRRMLLCEKAKSIESLNCDFFRLKNFPLCQLSFFYKGAGRVPIEPKIAGFPTSICECFIKGIVAIAFNGVLTDLSNDDIFRELQESREIEITDNFVFTPADYSRENPADYFISPTGLARKSGGTLLKISVDDLFITRKQIEKIKSFPNQSMPSMINNGVVTLDIPKTSVDGRHTPIHNGRPVPISEQQDDILRDAIKESGIDTKNYRKTSGDKAKVRKIVGNKLTNSQFNASWARLLAREITLVS